MTLTLTFSVLLIGAVIAQGILAAALLFLQQYNAKANRFLGLLVLLFSLWLCDTFFSIGNLYQQDPNLYFLPIYYSFAFGPLVYFYTKSITQQDFKFSKKDYWHFLPVLLQASLYIFLQCSDYNFRRWFWFEVHFPYTYNLEFHLSLLSLLVYLYLSYQLIQTYQNWIKNYYSEISTINLSWLKRVLVYLAIVCVFWSIDSILRAFWHYYSDQPFSAIAMGFVILALAIGGLVQIDLANKGIKNDMPELPTSKQEELDQQVLSKIKAIMTKQKPHLNPNLTLEAFAKMVKLPTRQVSTHINHGFNQSFIDFIGYCPRIGVQFKIHFQ